ncbi:hypothetical protein ACER0C_006543 [Sarotherodon galilaeus]
MHAPKAHRSSEHRQVKWPQARKEKEWLQFNEDVDTILQPTAKGQVEQRLKTMTTIIVSPAVERFGQEEKRTAKPLYTLNNRANKIHQLRQELKSLRQQFKVASEKERGPLAELRSIIRKRLLTLRRAEWHRRRRKERARSGHLVCPKSEVDHYLKETYSDECREQDLGLCQALINPSTPEQEFDGEEPSWKEIQEVVKRARASSAPGPSGVPYKVYKNCPRLLTRLWKILRVIWRRGKVANQWRQAEGVWIPKEERSKNINQFQTISLLSVEGKVLFSVVTKRLTEYLLKNSYIDNSVQKAGIPKVPGCLEHTGVVTQLIREARENRGDLAVLWLDLANDYGSIPHKLVEQALNQCYIPEKLRNLILDYCANFHLRVSCGTTTSDWHKLEKGIITGCTISPILFALAMNILKDAASIQATNKDLKTWLAAVDKSGLPGKFKAWIYQHGILPRILWPLLVYEVPISTVEGFKMRISRFLHRWLGLPRSLSSIALYGYNNKLKLPFSSLSEEFMVSQSRELLQYREFSDPRVALAGIEVRTGRKWRAAEAVDIAVSRLQQRVLVGTVAQGRGSRARGKERRSLILEEVRAGVEETRASQMVQLRQQVAWTRWEQAVERKAVYDMLPSSSNLFTWGKVETPGCLLCQKRGSPCCCGHILSCYLKALGEGRYRWRHDRVLKAVADSICSGISHNNSVCPVKNTVTFIKAGVKPAAPVRNTSPGLLATVHDWELRVDLAKQLKFPEAVAKTTLRPDIVVTSVVSKQVILLELTVPWEEHMEETHERKRAKYSELVEECRKVGCRGFAGQSLCRAYKMLGIVGANQRRAIKLVTNAAEAASGWLWIKRGEAWHVG